MEAHNSNKRKNGFLNDNQIRTTCTLLTAALTIGGSILTKRFMPKYQQTLSAIPSIFDISFSIEILTRQYCSCDCARLENGVCHL